MAVIDDLDRIADLCRVCAKKALDAMLDLGPKPEGTTEALLWEQQATRLQGQINSLTALVSKLTAAAVIEGLKVSETDLKSIGDAAKNAEVRIKQITDISGLLTKLAKVLDLGLALLAAAAAPSPMTITAVFKAGKAVDKDD